MHHRGGGVTRALLGTLRLMLVLAADGLDPRKLPLTIAERTALPRLLPPLDAVEMEDVAARPPRNREPRDVVARRRAMPQICTMRVDAQQRVLLLLSGLCEWAAQFLLFCNAQREENVLPMHTF